MNYYKKQPDYTTFLSYLLELHNLVTLLNARKINMKNDEKEREWYRLTALEMKRLNDEILTYSEEFLQLTEKIRDSKYSQQLFILQANKTDKYFNFLDLRMLSLRKQNEIALTEINKFKFDNV